MRNVTIKMCDFIIMIYMNGMKVVAFIETVC